MASEEASGMTGIDPLGSSAQEEISDESRKYGQNLSTGQKFQSGDL